MKHAIKKPRTYVKHLRNSDFKHEKKRLQIPENLVYEKFYIHEKILRAQNCCRKFINNFLLEKRKENM